MSNSIAAVLTLILILPAAIVLAVLIVRYVRDFLKGLPSLKLSCPGGMRASLDLQHSRLESCRSHCPWTVMP